MEKKYDFEPFNDWALVVPKAADKKVGILNIADDAIKKPQIGEVVAIGPGRGDVPIGFIVGDKIYFQQHGSVKINVNNQDLVLVNKEQMMGKYLEKNE